MNKTLITVLALVVAAACFAIGYSSAPKSFGSATITASNALDQAALQNELSLIASPLTGIYASSSANVGFVILGPVNAVTSTASTTLTFTQASGLGPFTLGDSIILGESTTTPSIIWTGNVINSSTLQILVQNYGGSAGILPATTTLFIKDLPLTSFVAPTGL